LKIASPEENLMKRIVALSLCVGLLSFAVFSQSSRTRPRVVVTDGTSGNQNRPVESGTPNETVPANDPARKPPVLIGENKQTPVSTEAASIEDDDEIIKVETNLVTIPVTVLDRDGRFISGLRQNDFQIFEDGMQQKIEYFASVETPFTVVLLLDVSNSTQFKIDEIQNAAITFIDQLRINDRVMVVSFDEKIKVLAQPTSNRVVLRDAIRQISFGGGTSLYEAVSHSINQELSRITGRKAIVLFTDGVDTTSKRATYQSTVREAEELDAMIYPIRFDTSMDMNSGSGSSRTPSSRRSGGSVLGQILGAIITGGSVSVGGGGSGTSQGEYEKGRRYLDELATVSGGRHFEARTIGNLDAAFSGIAEELRRQYAIGYYPEAVGQKGQRKNVKVRVDRSNAVVRNKNSYIVGAETANNTAARQPSKPAPRPTSRLPF
jgi:VWFA-related protein